MIISNQRTKLISKNVILASILIFNDIVAPN